MLVESKVFLALLRSVFAQCRVVYGTEPFGGLEHVLHYLARPHRQNGGFSLM